MCYTGPYIINVEIKILQKCRFRTTFARITKWTWKPLIQQTEHVELSGRQSDGTSFAEATTKLVCLSQVELGRETTQAGRGTKRRTQQPDWQPLLPGWAGPWAALGARVGSVAPTPWGRAGHNALTVWSATMGSSLSCLVQRWPLLCQPARKHSNTLIH